MTRTILLCLALVALGDWLFYGHPVGLSAALYLLALTGAVAARSRRSLAGWPPRLLLGALLGLALALALEPGPLVFALAALGLVSLAMVGRGGWTPSAAAWLERWSRFLAAGWLRPLLDARLCLARSLSGARHFPLPLRLARDWSPPLLASLVFVGLFGLANPVVEGWLSRLGSALADAWDGLQGLWNPVRVLFWIVLGVWTWALLRVRAWNGGSPRAPRSRPSERWSPRAVARSLLLFNLIFVVQNGLDARYLWGGAALPPGLTYAQYAHRGAYPLIATALLAAVFILATFRPGGASERDAWTRRLVYLWIAQNVFLTASGAWRLWLYVETYQLTRWRVAAALWFLLVGLGLAWILLRILLRRDNVWLFRANVLATAALLYACSFADFEGWIAWHNARGSAEAGGPGAPIDLAYLRVLGPRALPAAHWLGLRLGDTPEGALARELSAELERDLAEEIRDWRGWTLFRHRAIAARAALPRETPPLGPR